MSNVENVEARQAMRKCGCGKVAGEGLSAIMVGMTVHRWDGPCHSVLDGDVAPDDGPIEGYAMRAFMRRHLSPGWAQAEKELREEILGEQQPEPTATDEPSAHDLVIADMAARREFGLAKYGSLLQASNGRDNLQDLYEELLDACVYIRNEIERRKIAADDPEQDRKDHELAGWVISEHFRNAEVPAIAPYVLAGIKAARERRS